MIIGLSDVGGQDGSAFSSPISMLPCFVLLAKFRGVSDGPAQIAHDHGEPASGYVLEDLAEIPCG